MPGLICWNCGADTGIERRVPRQEQCESCLSDLRCCRGCRFFAPDRRFQCYETIDSSVLPKDKANFCDYFSPRVTGKAAGDGFDAKSERKSGFDDLFKD